MQHDIHEALSAPFADSDIEWRLQWADDDKGTGIAVPYVTNRAIQARLDKAVGAPGWKNEYLPWHSDGKKASQLCGISIYFADRKEWVTKYDGAEDSDIEPIKGGLSDSMKRAAVQWGIGRYLYSMDTVYVETEKRGKTTVIKKTSQSKLNEAHRRAVAAIFGTTQQPAPQPRQPQQPDNLISAKLSTSPQPPIPLPWRGGALAPGWSPPIALSAADVGTYAVGGEPNSPIEKPPPQSTKLTPKPTSLQTAQQPTIPISQSTKPTPQPTVQPHPSYQVTNTAIKPSTTSHYTLLQLKTESGETITAYMQGTDPAITPGSWLDNAAITTKKQNGVIYHTLDSFHLRPPIAA